MTVLYVLAGPTAAGKTKTAIAVAREMEAEIISADSMAIYRGMDIGTAKPTLAEREEVAHHLIDICDPWETFNVGTFVQLAAQTIAKIAQSGKKVLIVAGTPLYLKGLLEGIFEGPSADWKLREELLSRQKEQLYRELCEIDPETAENVCQNDLRRVIRALEVYYLTKTPISIYRKKHTRPPGDYRSCLVGLDWPREILYQRIEKRVDNMLDAGLVAETQRLLELPQPLSRTAREAIGYRDVIRALRQEINMDELPDIIKQSTRRFAKRQLTWWRHFTIEWMDATQSSASELATLILTHFRNFALLLVLSLLISCDMENQEFFANEIEVFGGQGTVAGRFGKPRAVTVCKNGNVYVVDMTGRIQAFSPKGDFVLGFRTPIIKKGKPTGLGISADGNILVADTHYHRILCYTLDGKLLYSFGEYGTEPQNFIYVTDVAASKDGYIYVTQYGGGLNEYDYIKKFDRSGRFIELWGQGGNAPGEFDRPMGLAIDDEGNILVVDACNHRIQKFTPEGKFLAMWGKPGSEKDELSYPYGIAVGLDKCIYVSEFGNNRIQKFSAEGKSLGCFGAGGRFPGMFANPWDIAIGEKGEIYVVDALNHRIQRISPDVFR